MKDIKMSNKPEEKTSAEKVTQQLLELADYSKSIKEKTFNKLASIVQPDLRDSEDMSEKYIEYPPYFEDLRKIIYKIENDLIDIESFINRVDL